MPQDENTAMLYAPNVFVNVPGMNGGQFFVPDGISRIGFDIDVREMTTGLDVEYRLYGPAQAHAADLRLMFPAALRNEAKSWFNDAASGKSVSKNIVVELRPLGGGPAKMKATLRECIPVSYDNEQVTLELSVGYIEINTLATFSIGAQDELQLPVIPTHLVETASASGAFNNHAIQVSGGAVRIQYEETTIGGDKFQTGVPSYKTVDTLTMRLVSATANVKEWINDTISGKVWKRTVEVSELTGGPMRIFYDAFPTRVTFLNPLLILPDGLAPAVLDLSIKPIRVELK